jgi:predicted HAD superfamily Cof-like phosphohydrolase
MNYIAKLEEFHKAVFKKTGYWQADIGQEFIPNNQTAQLRAKLHDEEICEVEDILYGRDDDCSKAHLLKELCDSLYVIFGTAAIYGLYIEEAFARVHENNMLKLTTGNLNDLGKFVKAKDHPKVYLGDLVNENEKPEALILEHNGATSTRSK